MDKKETKQEAKIRLLLENVKRFYHDKSFAIPMLKYFFGFQDEIHFFSYIADHVGDRSVIEELISKDRPKEVIEDNGITTTYIFYLNDPRRWKHMKLKGEQRRIRSRTEHWVMDKLISLEYDYGERGKGRKKYMMEFK